MEARSTEELIRMAKLAEQAERYDGNEFLIFCLPVSFGKHTFLYVFLTFAHSVVSVCIVAILKL